MEQLHDIEAILGGWGDLKHMEPTPGWNFDMDGSLEGLLGDSDSNSFKIDVSPPTSPLSPYPGSSPADSDCHTQFSSSSSDDDFSFDQPGVNMLEIVGMDPLFDLTLCDAELEQIPLFENQQPTQGFTVINSPSAFEGSSSLPPLPVTNGESMSQVQGDVENNNKGKKRRRTHFNATAAARVPSDFVELSEEDMLKLDSEQIESYIKNLASSRSMAPSEERELKRVRRLIKNREYAQSSRNKKKQYMEEMENKLQGVVDSKAELQQRIDSLEVENRTLKMHLAKLGTAIKQDPEIMERLKNPNSSHRKAKSLSIKTGAVLFAVMLFSISFGWMNMATPSSPIETNTLSPSGASRWNTGRVLLGNELLAERPVGLYSVYTPQYIQDFLARHFGISPTIILEGEGTTICNSESLWGSFEPLGDRHSPRQPLTNSCMSNSFSSSAPTRL